MTKPLPNDPHRKPVPQRLEFGLFLVAAALLSWLFSEPTGVALGKSFIEPLGLFNVRPKEKYPEAAAPQTNTPPVVPAGGSEADEMAKERAAEEERAKRRQTGQSTVLTSSLNFNDDEDTKKKPAVRKTALGAGA